MPIRLALIIILTIAFTVSLPNSVHSIQPNSASWDSGFDKQRALHHVYVLASDSLRGRYSGFQGADKLDAYVTDHFARIGLEKPFGDDGYLHKFHYGAGEYSMPSSLSFQFQDGTVDTANMWQDFNIYKYSGFGDVTGQLLFAGYGISTPDKGWDEYEGVDVAGKVVLVMRGVPELPNVKWSEERGSGYKSTLALERGAVGFIMTDGVEPKYATIGEKSYRANIPAVWLSSNIADSLLKATGRTKSEWAEAINQNRKPVSQLLDITASLQVSGEYYPERQTHNFVGILPGADPNLKREAILIGAHSDHHGVDAVGNVYPGADDNASGAAVMMEVAELFSSAERNRRTLIFAGFAAEEEGLVGSKKLVESLPISDYRVVAMINMDMVGQGDGSIGVAGLNEFPMLGDLMFSNWSDSALSELVFWGLHGSSDQASFMEAGIPSYIVGARGKHPNYHTPNDTAGAINADILQSVGNMTYRCAELLASHPEPLSMNVDKGKRLLMRHGGTQFIALNSAYKPDYKPVEGVDYSDPITFVSLTEADEVLSGFETARSIATERSIAYMADSLHEGYRGESYSGMTLILNGSRLQYDGKSLKSLSRLGVSFVDVTEPAQSKKKKVKRKLAQVLKGCQEADLLPCLQSVGSDASDGYKQSTNLSELWSDPYLQRLDYLQIGGRSLLDFLDKNCFLLLDAENARLSEYGYIVGELKRAMESGSSAKIGLIAKPPLLNRLMMEDIDEEVIAGLLCDNLKIWMRDSR